MSYKSHQTAYLAASNSVPVDTLAKFDHVIVDHRRGIDYPDDLKAIADSGAKLWIYVSVVDSWPDYKLHPAGGWARRWGEVLTSKRMWLPLAGNPTRRARGSAPEVMYWSVSAVNTTHPEFPELFAMHLEEYLEQMCEIAKAPVNWYADNTFDAFYNKLFNSAAKQEANAAGIDGDRDGLPDDRDAFDAAHRDNMCAMLERFRSSYVDMPIIGNGDNTLHRWINGRWCEQWQVPGRDYRTWETWESILSGPWREPSMHFLQGGWRNSDGTPAPGRTETKRAFAGAAVMGFRSCGIGMHDYYNADPWIDEFDLELGAQASTRDDSGDYKRRKYEAGDVRYNTATRGGEVKVGSWF